MSKSGIQGELPKVLTKEFCHELAVPLSHIYNNIITTGIWPAQWKTELGLPLKKINQSRNEDDIRIISLTPLYSKVFEKFVIGWLLDHLQDKIDLFQYGGQKGHSVSHYLIDFINFVAYNQDVSNIQAVLAVTVDFSKVFNRQNHLILVELLSELGVPGWLLRIIIGFLKDREMEVLFKGVKSSRKKLPGGSPQGTILGMFLFLILINGAGFHNLLRNTGHIITDPSIRKRQPIERIHFKWIDDLTVAESVDLRKTLVHNNDLQHPSQYHDRTGHSLPSNKSKVQAHLDDLVTYSNVHQMKINKNKTNAILFNRARKFDFQPRLTIGCSDFLNVVDEFKLLGVMVQADLKWHANTSYMCKKGYSRLWVLRRLKSLGTSATVLLDVYMKQVRCMVEYASPVWSGNLTKGENRQIERVQKAAFSIILGSQYKCYEHALKVFNCETLEDRRKGINLKFAKKSSKHPKFAHWFSFVQSRSHGMETRRKHVNAFAPVQARTKTFANSPRAYLTNLLTEDSSLLDSC